MPANATSGTLQRTAGHSGGGDASLSLETYMADAHTRVFTCNGRKLVSKLGRDTFPGQRIHKLPPKVIEFASRQPLTSALLPCRIGYFPNARGQWVSRPNGDWAFTLLYCLDGRGHLQLANTRHVIRRGMFTVLRPFEFHAYEADAAHPWSYYWIHFNGTLAQQYFDLLTGGGGRQFVSTVPDMSFVQSFERILAILNDGTAYKILVQASATLHQLLGDLYGMICHDGSPPETREARVGRTIEVMRNNLSMHVSIQELAAVANMSHAYYAQHFRRVTGENPRSYINKLKIEKACEYLRSTHAKVENIAHAVGYEDPFYFCRLFKRLTGHTPSGYREANRSAPVGAGAAGRVPHDEATR